MNLINFINFPSLSSVARGIEGEGGSLSPEILSPEW